VAVTFSLVLTNDGLEAPGAALSVEPMVRVPPDHLHPPDGTFILTSVLVQTPITAGEWVVGKLNPVVKIVPPETIVPEDTTPQEQARQGFEMLDESETTAIVVGLRLAGFKADLVGKGIEVVELQPDSHAVGILQPGDVITQVNGEAVLMPSELVDRIKAQTGKSVRLAFQRAGRQLEADVPLIPPIQSGDAPRIGVVIQPAGFDVDLPFPVEIHSQKIVGGPSAGLMFTLTVYNLLTPDDLTAGLRIAGTGTIALDGTVGPIGGVEQKVAAAEAAGAVYFLCPADNYNDAVAVARNIQVIKIANVEQALTFLQGLPGK
jgi:PDZ domain-containing protein